MEVRTQWVMGTTLRIALRVPASAKADQLFELAFRVVHEADDLLSNYRPDSALGRLNAAAGRGWREVPEPLYAFLTESLSHGRRTRGAFDVTVGPLVQAWRSHGPPTPSRLARARRNTGQDLLSLGPSGRVRLMRSGMLIDPGAIGKGWALDRLVAALRSAGVERAFVDFGGSSFHGLGTPEGRPGWPVLLQGPGDHEALGVLWLKDASLSSSKSLRPTDDGQMKPHIVDPRTGWLVTEARVAAVIAPSATTAEVLSTALVVAPRLQGSLGRSYPHACAITQSAGRVAVKDPCAALILGSALPLIRHLRKGYVGDLRGPEQVKEGCAFRSLRGGLGRDWGDR